MTALPKVARPALRALAGIGVFRLDQLARHDEATIAALHGMGPKAMIVLREALHAAGMSFRRG